jgi:hypothetical protein
MSFVCIVINEITNPRTPIARALLPWQSPLLLDSPPSPPVAPALALEDLLAICNHQRNKPTHQLEQVNLWLGGGGTINVQANLIDMVI